MYPTYLLRPGIIPICPNKIFPNALLSMHCISYSEILNILYITRAELQLKLLLLTRTGRELQQSM